MRIEDLKKSIDDYFQVSQSKKEDIRTLYEKAAENLSEPASMLFRLYDDLLEQAELLLKQCAEEALNIENLVEGLIKYAENNIEKNNHNSVIEAQGISQALAEKGANEYLPPGLLKKFEERREKIRKHPIPPLQHAYHEAQPAQTSTFAYGAQQNNLSVEASLPANSHKEEEVDCESNEEQKSIVKQYFLYTSAYFKEQLQNAINYCGDTKKRYAFLEMALEKSGRVRGNGDHLLFVKALEAWGFIENHKNYYSSVKSNHKSDARYLNAKDKQVYDRIMECFKDNV